MFVVKTRRVYHRGRKCGRVGQKRICCGNLVFLVPRLAVCELYSGGDLCEPYLKGQQIYVAKKRPQTSQKNLIETNYHMLEKYVSVGCRDYVLPALCNYGFPPCDLTQSEAKPRKFCQDDCLILKNDICKIDFQNALRIPVVSNLLPDCDSMPAKGDPGYKSCIRVVSQG